MCVVGLVGPFGSGCSYVADTIAEKRNYTKLSLSEVLKNIYSDCFPEEKPTRKELQEFGNFIREANGADYLAEQVYNIINENGNPDSKSFVVDSIRNTKEVDYFRENIPQFFLFGVFAEKEVRWKRVSKKYDGDSRAFDDDDQRDSGENQDDFGQQVTAAFRNADIIIHNNLPILNGNDASRQFLATLMENLDYIEKKKAYHPTACETCMTMAYAASMRSFCLKRKVGAVIVDENGNVFSSGYNEVPSTQNSCYSEYGVCYRDRLKEKFKEDLNVKLLDTEKSKAAYAIFKESFKILDYCRSLHAEENAILNVARIGASSVLSSSTLYTTTYPCNLCANKIAQVGIKRVVYFEPYPMPEAKKILMDQGVYLEAFQGVTYNGYFRLMEEIL